ncbi:thioredoxin [Aquipseudomonas campi]
MEAKHGITVTPTRPNSLIESLELTDFDADHQLLELSGLSLLVFTSAGCASCRWARRHLPELPLSVTRITWVDAGENGGLVQRYGVFHLPALFLVRDGAFLGALSSQLNTIDLEQAIAAARCNEPEELP